MARTFVQTDTAADVPISIEGYGGILGDTTFDREMAEGGSGSGTVSPAIGNNASDIERVVGAFNTDVSAPEPNDASWEAGDYTVNINITTARSGIEWRKLWIYERTNGPAFNLAGTVTFGTPIDLSSTGIKTGTFNRASSYTAATTSTMIMQLIFGGQFSHGGSDVDVTMGEDVVTPLAAPAAGGAPHYYNQITRLQT